MYCLNLLRTFAAQKPWVTCLNIAFTAVLPLNDVFLPHLYGQLVESIRNNSNFAGVFITILVTLAVVHGVALAADLHDTYVTPAFQAHVRSEVLKTVFRNHETSYHDLSTGKLLSVIIKSPNTVLTMFNRFKDYLLPYAFLFLSAAAYFCWFDWMLGLFIALAVGLIVALLVVAPHACSEASNAKATLYSRLQDEVDDLVRNMMSIYTSDRIDQEISRINDLDNEHVASCSKTMRCALFYKMLGFPLIIAVFAFFVLRCHALTRSGRLSVGIFVSLLMIMTSMMHNLMWVVDIIRDIVFDSGFLVTAERQITAKMRTGTGTGTGDNEDGGQEYLRHAPGAPTPHPDGVGLHRVTFAYGGSSESSESSSVLSIGPRSTPNRNDPPKGPVIDDLTLHFAPGERVVISGPIGAGKSTVGKLIDRLYTPSAGDLYIGGRWYSDMTPSEIRARIGYVPQQPVLFNRTVYENIGYGNGASEADIDALVNKLDVASEFTGLENGMRSRIGRNGSKLSGGQRQLVWCLRTLLTSPDVVVLDEPTASMDEATKETLERVLDALTADKIVIIVSHDEFVLERATRVINLV